MSQREIVRCGADDPEVVTMIAEVQQEYVRRYGGPDESPFDAAQFAAPLGAMFVVRVDDTPVAMAGWRARPELAPTEVTGAPALSPAEIKRMYVRPSHQRQGLARALLTQLVHSAHDAGHDALILETGTAQPEAISLYESAGFTPIAPFGHYACTPGSRHLGRRLRALP